MSIFEIVKVTTIIYDISKNINWNHRLFTVPFNPVVMHNYGV